MEHPLYIYIIALVGAVIAGAVNSLAGNGSAITLSILTELIGLPGNMANGTNRIGVLMNGMGSTWGYYRGGKLDLSQSKSILITVFAGSIAGGAIALSISNEQFMWIFRVLMVLMFIVILVNPRRWLIDAKQESRLSKPVMLFLYFLTGVYGGLIQMGMGIFFLAVLVLLDGFPIVYANAIKVTAVALFTVLILALFAWRGLVEWEIGLILGFGQFFGGWGTARLASKYRQMDKWAYGLLVVIVVVSLLSLFGVIQAPG